jgi:hypothetical protein
VLTVTTTHARLSRTPAQLHVHAVGSTSVPGPHVLPAHAHEHVVGSQPDLAGLVLGGHWPAGAVGQLHEQSALVWPPLHVPVGHLHEQSCAAQ